MAELTCHIFTSGLILIFKLFKIDVLSRYNYNSYLPMPLVTNGTIFTLKPRICGVYVKLSIRKVKVQHPIILH